MNTLRPWLLLVICSSWLMVGGCYHCNGYERESSQWAAQPNLGKVRIVVLPDRDIDHDLAHTKALETQVAKSTAEILEKIPGTTALSDPSTGIGQEMTICRIAIGNEGNRFLIGIPDLWDLRAEVDYDIEIIDKASGEVLFKAVRRTFFGGFLNFLPLPDSAALYKRDLTYVMRHYAR